MKRLVLSLVMSLACVAFLAPNAFSDTITFGNNEYNNGTGIGATIHVLSLNQAGNATIEEGSVLPIITATGTTGTGTTGDGDQPNSRTYTSAELTSAGLNETNLGLVFNPNETGAGAEINTVDVQSFSLDFYSPIYTGTTVTGWYFEGSTLLEGTPVNIEPISTGTGSSGWLMDYNEVTGGLLTQFFDNSDWVLGASGFITNVDDGPDNFYLINTGDTPPPVPEPSALLLLGSGLVGLAVYGRKAFKR